MICGCLNCCKMPFDYFYAILILNAKWLAFLWNAIGMNKVRPVRLFDLWIWQFGFLNSVLLRKLSSFCSLFMRSLYVYWQYWWQISTCFTIFFFNEQLSINFPFNIRTTPGVLPSYTWLMSTKENNTVGTLQMIQFCCCFCLLIWLGGGGEMCKHVALLCH